MMLLLSFQNFTAARLSLSELKKVTSLLCKKFHVQNKLDIEYIACSDYRMQYAANVCYVNKSSSQAMPDSLVYFYLLHEFRHYMQDSNGIFKRRTGLTKLDAFYDKRLIVQANKKKSTIWFPDDIFDIEYRSYNQLNLDDVKYVKEVQSKLKKYSHERIFKPYEYDAEMFAVQNISCPLCYDIILSDVSRSNISIEGYWGFNAMMQHRESKQSNQYCKAHSFSKNKKSNRAISSLRHVLYTPSNIDFETYKKTICDFDNKCGTLSDRHTK